MELALFFYAAGVSDSLALMLFWIGGAVTGIILMTSAIGYMNADISWDSTEAKAAVIKRFKYVSRYLIAGIVAMLVSSLIPSKDTMYTMAAAYGVQSAAENPNVQRVAGKSLQLLEGKLDEYLKGDKK